MGSANAVWIIAGIAVTFLFVLFNGLMYTSSFKVVQKEISLFAGIQLFLKRNLISVFLPGGGFTSLAFFTREIEKQGISKTKISFASYIYGTVGIASLVIVAIPVLIYLAVSNSASHNVWPAFAGLLFLVILLSVITYSFLKKGWIYKRLVRLSPQVELISKEISSGEFSLKPLFFTLFYSILIEVGRMLHLYLAMKALDMNPNIESCIAGYVIATLFLCISPFLRGLGAVEVSLTYILTTYGFSDVQAISITIIYRVFEFWLPWYWVPVVFSSIKEISF